MNEPKTRSPAQNRKFQPMVRDIAKQTTHHGQRLQEGDWLRLLLNAFRWETKDDPELRDDWARFGQMRLVPALNNPGFVAVGESSRDLTVKLASAFVEWLYAYGVEQGVRFTAPEYMTEPA